MLTASLKAISLASSLLGKMDFNSLSMWAQLLGKKYSKISFGSQIRILNDPMHLQQILHNFTNMTYFSILRISYKTY